MREIKRKNYIWGNVPMKLKHMGKKPARAEKVIPGASRRRGMGVMGKLATAIVVRSEEQTSELQSQR